MVQARTNLKTAVRLFVEEAQKMGTLVKLLPPASRGKGGMGGYKGNYVPGSAPPPQPSPPPRKARGEGVKKRKLCPCWV